MKNLTLSLISGLLSVLVPVQIGFAQMPYERVQDQMQGPGAGMGQENRSGPVLPGQTGPASNEGVLKALMGGDLTFHKPGADAPPVVDQTPAQLQSTLQSKGVDVKPILALTAVEGAKSSLLGGGQNLQAALTLTNAGVNVSDVLKLPGDKQANLTAAVALVRAGVDVTSLLKGPEPALSISAATSLLKSGVFSAGDLNTFVKAGGNANALASAVNVSQESGAGFMVSSLISSGKVTPANVVALAKDGQLDAAVSVSKAGVDIGKVLANGGTAAVGNADRMLYRGVSANSMTMLMNAGIKLGDIQLPRGVQGPKKDLSGVNLLLNNGVKPQNVATLLATVDTDTLDQAAAIVGKPGVDLNAIIETGQPGIDIAAARGRLP